jgi:FkbM family methyltransferase
MKTWRLTCIALRRRLVVHERPATEVRYSAEPPAATTPRAATGLRGVVRGAIRFLLEGALRTRAGLAAVNRLHRALSLAQKRRFYYLSVDLPCRAAGPWTVSFAGRRLVLPLHPDFDFGWTAATAFHGYETEIYELYEALLQEPRPPRVFFDVGASYGLHSLKFLAHGVRVVSFEPNTACHPFFLACCRRNGVAPDLRPVAIGAGAGEVRLWVPTGQTWLGTTVERVARTWGDDGVETLSVWQTSLDEVVRRDGLMPDVVKIDTEGSELSVLVGADEILRRARPLIILESWPERQGRRALFDLLSSYDYDLHALQFAEGRSPALALDAFESSVASNFVSRPAVRPA